MSTQKQAQKSVSLTCKVWMSDKGMIQVQIGDSLAHVSKEGQTNLYPQLVKFLKEQGAALPV
jgi:hypothetical protein